MTASPLSPPQRAANCGPHSFMAQEEPCGPSRSLTVYSLLLTLYPQPYLRQHRAELLQNFEDFERTLPSKSELWLFIGKDLLYSLRSQFIKTLWGQTAIVVAVLAILLVFTRHRDVARVHGVELFCLGYILGWFAGWFGKQWRVFSFKGVLRAIGFGALALFIIGAVKAGAQAHSVWAFCYGATLACIAGWIGNRRQTRL